MGCLSISSSSFVCLPFSSSSFLFSFVSLPFYGLESTSLPYFTHIFGLSLSLKSLNALNINELSPVIVFLNYFIDSSDISNKLHVSDSINASSILFNYLVVTHLANLAKIKIYSFIAYLVDIKNKFHILS